MRILLVALMLVLVSIEAMAEWVNVGDASNNSLTVYINSATIRRNGNMVKMWTLLDYKTAEVTAKGIPFLSSKSQKEYDCKEERVRGIALVFTSGNMGQGDVIFDDNYVDNWVSISPDSVGERLWKIACGKL